MYYIPKTDGKVREFADVRICNLVTKENNQTLSLAVADLSGSHPRSESKLSDRAYYIVNGAGRFDVGAETFSVSAGDAVFIPKNTSHAMDGEMCYVVVNVPPFDPAAEQG